MKKNTDLINIYEKAWNSFYNNKDNSHHKSKHWKRYDFNEFNLENLINFRNDGILSGGLDDHNDKFSFKVYSEIVNEISEEFILKNLPKENIGNSNFLIKYKNVFVDYHKLIDIYWYWIIENKILKQNKIKSVCEIGAGFGSFSELLVRNYNTKLFLIDLPEGNLMSSYFLKELFPEKNFFLFDDYQKSNFLSINDFNNYDIIILPPHCIIDEKIKIDFFINARSMMEMNMSVIINYFDFIHKHIDERGFFLNINRYEKSSVGYPIRIAEYPYDESWKVLVSQPSIQQEWIHFLLTQRSFEKSESDIKQELINIKDKGEKFSRANKDYMNSLKYYGLKKPIAIFLKYVFTKKTLSFFGNLLTNTGNKLKNLK